MLKIKYFGKSFPSFTSKTKQKSFRRDLWYNWEAISESFRGEKVRDCNITFVLDDGISGIVRVEINLDLHWSNLKLQVLYTSLQILT